MKGQDVKLTEIVITHPSSKMRTASSVCHKTMIIEPVKAAQLR